MNLICQMCMRWLLIAVFAVGIAVVTVTSASAEPAVRISEPELQISEDGVEFLLFIGTIGDTPYQIAVPTSLPADATLLLGSHHFLGDQNSSNTILRREALWRGWAYAASQEGWNHVGSNGEKDSYFESRARIIQLVGYAQGVIEAEFGRRPQTTYIAGFSLGAHHTIWMLEQFGGIFDGGVALAPLISTHEWRRYISAVARSSDGRVAELAARLKNGFQWNSGYAGFSAEEAPIGKFVATNILVPRLISKFDPSYTGPVDAWDPDKRLTTSDESTARRLDVTGAIGRPLIIVHGRGDTITSPNHTAAYTRLARSLNPAAPVRIVLPEQLGHLAFAERSDPSASPNGEDAGDALTSAALDALDAWVRQGTVPTTVGGVAAQ